MLSFLYRLLSGLKTQDDVTKDMQLAFEEARIDARASGWWRYTAFAAREICGLFNLPDTRLWWLRSAGWSLAGLLAGWIVWYLLPLRYTSEATLRLVPAMVSPELVPRDIVNVESWLEIEMPGALSRNLIATIINKFDLYPNSRQRQPMEDLVVEFKRSVRIERAGASLIRVAFTYGDSPSGTAENLRANRVTHELVDRVITAHIAQRSALADETVRFFRKKVEEVGQSWLKLNTSTRTTPSSDPRYELLALARDQKRKEYESLSQKLGVAETLRDLEHRGQGARLELLDPPSVPEKPDTAHSVILLVGFGCGLASGLLTALWRALRPPSSHFAISGAAPA